LNIKNLCPDIDTHHEFLDILQITFAEIIKRFEPAKLVTEINDDIKAFMGRSLNSTRRHPKSSKQLIGRHEPLIKSRSILFGATDAVDRTHIEEKEVPEENYKTRVLFHKAKYLVIARKVLVDRLHAKDKDGRFCHFTKSYETEDVFNMITRHVLEFKPFKL